MSRIDELIEQYAPNGVPYRPLADAFLPHFSGYWGSAVEGAEVTARAVRNVDLGRDGRIQWESLPLRGYSKREASKATLRKDDILLTASGECGKVAHLSSPPDEPTVATNFVKVMRAVADVDPRFAYHFMRSTAFVNALPRFVRGAAMTNLDLPALLQAVRVPVPPLEVQREIVRVLDQFTQLEAELEAELEARRSQYEYYRDKLLTFKEAA